MTGLPAWITSIFRTAEAFGGESKLRCAGPKASALDLEAMNTKGDAVLDRFLFHSRYRHNPRQIPANSHDFQISLSILF